MCYYNKTVKIKPIHTKVLNCDSSILAGLGLKTLHFNSRVYATFFWHFLAHLGHVSFLIYFY